MEKEFITITKYSSKNAEERFRVHLHAYRTTVGRYACLGYVYFNENNRYSFDMSDIESLELSILHGITELLTLRFLPDALLAVLFELQNIYSYE